MTHTAQTGVERFEKPERTGKVWLVGAGPGDPGLLTLRAREAIEGAEVVVYDRLVGLGIAEFFPENATVFYVGKRVGNHAVAQEEIEEILLREARAGHRVVRVKGGDPYLFGRGGEEAVALTRAGIDVEVVPGVTSAISVPAYAGIPVTHRNASAGVYIVTAHRTCAEDLLDYNFLAQVEDTLVILMGACRIDEIATGLMRAGMDPATPAAVIQDGTTARMKRVIGEISNIAAQANENKIDAPAVFVVGAVAGMGERLNWRAHLPFAGTRVWLTESKKTEPEYFSHLSHLPYSLPISSPPSPAAPTDVSPGPFASYSVPPLPRLLRDAGAEAISVPCIATEFVPAELPPNEALGENTWFLFSSQTGVAGFFNLLRRERRDIRAMSGIKFAAVGPATARALALRGLVVNYVPEVHDGQSLAQGLADRIKNAKIFLFRCVGEPPAWQTILEDAGAEVSQIALYRTRPTSSAMLNMLKQVAPGDVVVFKSASAVRVFAEASSCDRASIRAVCIGKPSAQAASEYGFHVATAARADDEAIYRAILESGK